MIRKPAGLRYVHIAEEIREEIADGQFVRGDVLPSQSDLAGRFGASVMTIRQALRVLENEGLVEFRHGVGSFVAGLSEDHRSFELQSFSQLLDTESRTIETTVIDRNLQVSNHDAEQQLDVAPGAVCSLARLRSLRSTPVVYQVSYLPERFGRIVQTYEPGTSLYSLLGVESDRIISIANETITAVIPSIHIAGLLQVSDGIPCLHSRRLSRDVRGVPVLFDEAYMPGSQVQLMLTRNGRNADYHFVVDHRESQSE